MKMLTRNETAEFLRRFDNYTILTHRRPDGDTIGSAAGLCRILRNLGKTAHVLANPEVTPKYQWLLEGLTKETPQENDCIISVDVASPGMLPEEYLPYLEQIRLRIDHHGTATSFTPYELVDAHAGACAEIIYDLGDLLPVPLDSATADAIYTATSTDTGCFRFPNTTDHTFTVAAACAAAGARVFQLNQIYFETNTFARLRIQSWIVEHLEFFNDGKIALVAIPKSVEEELGVTEDDMDNISGFPRTIEGVCMAATLRHTKKGNVKLSLRAVPGWDASAVCARFGGGGHAGAAGATLYLPMEEAAQAVKTAINQLTVDN